jgi:hypothetical protein
MSGWTDDFAETGSTHSVVCTRRSAANSAGKLYERKTAININGCRKFNSLNLVLH